MSQDSKSLSDTPMTDEREFDATYADDKGNVVPADFSRELERDNARLREEVEMLNVRHAASMLHAQTHADEYNALREEVNGLLQDIQRLTEEAFEHDKQLAEAKRDTGLAKLVIQQKQDQITSAEAALEQAEARALAAENKVAWQEVETADLRDDVKRLHKTVSECEERALAADKDKKLIASAGALIWYARWAASKLNSEQVFLPHTEVEQFRSLAPKMEQWLINSGYGVGINFSKAQEDIAAIGAKHD